MKKLLYQLDTDFHPAVFDNVVAYDGGADHVTAYGGVTPANVGPLVDGAIFTRAPKEKKNTAIFVGGSNMADGEALFKAVKKKFFANFRVSVMLDSNGSNTTAAAAVAWLVHAAPGQSLAGKRAVVLAGTGPVGQRAAVMLAREGARVAITSRDSCARAGGRQGDRRARRCRDRSAHRTGQRGPRAGHRGRERGACGRRRRCRAARRIGLADTTATSSCCAMRTPRRRWASPAST